MGPVVEVSVGLELGAGLSVGLELGVSDGFTVGTFEVVGLKVLHDPVFTSAMKVLEEKHIEVERES